VEGHFLIIEIEIPSKDSTMINVKIADSVETSLDDLIEDVRFANIDLLICSLNTLLEIDYQKASDVIHQGNLYDCGICCLQRLYFWKRFETLSPISEEYDYLKDTVTFRLFVLSAILDYNRPNLSTLVYIDHPNIRKEKLNFLKVFTTMNMDKGSITVLNDQKKVLWI
jgi:hypothetical protein